MISKKHILDEIRRTAEENGNKPLGRNRFQNETGIKESDWLGKYWVRWSDAIMEAGFPPNTKQVAYETNYLIEKLVKLIRELGKYPTRPELRLKRRQDSSFPSDGAFYRLGNKNDIIGLVIEYCIENNENKRIIELCKKAMSVNSIANKSPAKSRDVEYGFVYLMKSGHYYKIGRSNSAERREYELKIILPQGLKLIHKIKTDDPIGIEKYWHERFKDKRKRGEWFDLSTQDIKAFKWRKIM